MDNLTWFLVGLLWISYGCYSHYIKTEFSDSESEEMVMVHLIICVMFAPLMFITRCLYGSIIHKFKG